MVRVGTYARVSSEQQAAEGVSLGFQAETLPAFVTLKGWTHGGHEEDAGISGSTLDRPGLQRQLDRVQAGELQGLCVYKLDRLSRSLLDFLQVVRFLDQHGAFLVSVSESIDTSTPAGRMIVHVLMSFAEYERETIRERTVATMTHRAKAGKWNGGRVPYGYANEGGSLVPHPEQANTVRWIFREYLETESTVTVRDELNHRHPKPGSRRWTKGTVAHMLRSPLYVGRIRYKGEVVEGEHAALVEFSTWARAQDLLDANSKTNGSRTRPRSHGLAIVGLVYCPCGRALSVRFSYRNGKRYDYLGCPLAKRCEQSRKVNGKTLEADILAVLVEAAEAPEVIREALKRAQQESGRERRQLTRELARLEKEEAAAQRKATKLLRALGDADLSLVREEVTRLEGEREAVRARLRETREALAQALPDDVDPAKLSAALGDVLGLWEEGTPAERRQLLEALTERIEWDGLRVRVSLARGLGARWLALGSGERLRAPGSDLAPRIGRNVGPVRGASRTVALRLLGPVRSRTKAKPKAPKGQRGYRVLEPSEVAAILALRGEASSRDVGRRYGVSHVTVCRIWARTA